MTRPPKAPQRQAGRDYPRFRADDARRRKQAEGSDPHDPANHTTYKVKAGDTLTRIAAPRTGLTPADLRWLNALAGDHLQVGQELKIPTQAFLDENAPKGKYSG